MPGKREYVALDVEAVATGRGHNDRTPCRVSVVDKRGRVLLDKIIHVPEENIYDPLTEITGLTTKQIQSSTFTLSDAKNALRKIFCGKSTVIIGQSPQIDIEWMNLQKGVDFARSIDIAKVFRAWDPRYNNWRHFSLAETTYGLLNERIQETFHSSIVDAQKSMQLFLRFGQDKAARQRARARLFRMACQRRFPPKNRGPEHICPWKFNPKRCFCGQICSQ
jgi:RNA exonuclease 4